jgi:agmatine deiminase
MITDAQTDFVYFSAKLKEDFETFYNDITKILDRHSIKHDLLPETNDIWCRDYMPVQVSDNKFIEYRYDPDYLQAQKWRPSKSYPDIICDKLDLKTVKTDVILDGGNVIKTDSGVILTNKIFKENKAKYNNDQLIGKLKELFEVDQITVIPWDKYEKYGHADGMIRFIGGKKVLINGYFREYDKAFQASLFGSLDRAGLEVEELIYQGKNLNDDINWGYINYLQIRDLLLIPKFGLIEDKQAFDQISRYFPDYERLNKIEQIDASVIIKEGGALNCISWNIKKQSKT